MVLSSGYRGCRVECFPAGLFGLAATGENQRMVHASWSGERNGIPPVTEIPGTESPPGFCSFLFTYRGNTVALRSDWVFTCSATLIDPCRKTYPSLTFVPPCQPLLEPSKGTITTHIASHHNLGFFQGLDDGPIDIDLVLGRWQLNVELAL